MSVVVLGAVLVVVLGVWVLWWVYLVSGLWPDNDDWGW